MSTALVKTESMGLALNEIMTLGDVFKSSGYFKDVRDQAQAVVKILYGKELGFAPVVSMMGIHIIEGKPSLSANLMGAMVKRSGKYDYRVKTLTDAECVLDFTQDKQPAGTSSFTMKDAQQAGVVRQGSGWTKYPRNMLFARALSNGVKLFCPELSACPVYIPEELGAEVNEDGNVTELPKSARPVEVTTEDIPIKPKNGANGHSAEDLTVMPPEESLITIEQAQKLHMRFRDSLREDLRPKADALLHEWLGLKMYLDAHGNPSASAVTKAEFVSVGKAVVAYAKELS